MTRLGLRMPFRRYGPRPMTLPATIESNPYPFSIDVPVSAPRARAVDIAPMMVWCESVFGAEWRPRNRRDRVRFCFRSERALAQFAEEWRPRL